MPQTSVLRNCALALIALLQGCSTLTEGARIEVADDTSSTFYVLISHPSTYQSEKAIAPEEIVKWEESAKACGATTRVYGRASDKRHVLQIQLNSRLSTELAATMECAAAADRRFPKLEITTDEGILSRDVTLHLSARLASFSLFGEEPKSISVKMPTPISSFKDTSRSKFDLVVAEVSGQSATIVVKSRDLPDAEAKAIFERLCKDKDKCLDNVEAEFPRHISFKLTSSKSKLTAQDLLALLGVLLGSGLLIEVGRTVYARIPKK